MKTVNSIGFTSRFLSSSIHSQPCSWLTQWRINDWISRSTNRSWKTYDTEIVNRRILKMKYNKSEKKSKIWYKGAVSTQSALRSRQRVGNFSALSLWYLSLQCSNSYCHIVKSANLIPQIVLRSHSVEERAIVSFDGDAGRIDGVVFRRLLGSGLRCSRQRFEREHELIFWKAK